MQHRVRAIWVLVILACGFTVISYNLIQIQLVQHDKYWRLAVGNYLHSETIAPKRGTIYDSDGNILAQTQMVSDISLDGKLLDRPEDQIAQVAKILQVPPERIMAGYSPRNRNELLAKDVDDSVVTQLHALKWSNCLIIRPHQLRSYPNNELAAHILGYSNSDGQGLAGVEKEMDKLLTGVAGERWIERWGSKNAVSAYQVPDTPAINGDNVTLTIKTAIQHAVEGELDQIVQTYQPKGAYIIVMDPHTGEILGMGSRPTYDPNDSRTFKQDALQNGCITDAVEPGSIFKVIPVAAALNEGAINLDTTIDCTGPFYYGTKNLRDDEPNGVLSIMEVLAKSSNIGCAKIGINYLGEEKLYQYARAFGMGQRTELFDGQGESTGILHPLNKWSGLSIARVPMGQEVAVTPIQMAMMMSVIANGGRLLAPQLIKQVTDETGRVVKAFPPRVLRQVISPAAAREVTRALIQVTVDGTAKNIHIDGFSYAAKTGTAQVFENGEYSHTKHVASFLGFLPVDDPAFVALVMVDQPQTGRNKDYGAQVSGPVFAALAKQVAQIMNIPPDQPTAPVLSVNTSKTP